MNFTEEELKQLDKYIEQKIKKIIKDKYHDDYGNMRGWDAKVSSVNGDGTINVFLIVDPLEEIISNLKNKTNEILIANDEVYLISISSIKNAFVGIKK